MKCVELTAVYDDGTVERVTGDGLSEWWQEAQDHAGECGMDGVEWESFKPLRKVTERTGNFVRNFLDGVPALCECYFDSVLLPDECLDGQEMRYRITVEAVPVEGEKP